MTPEKRGPGRKRTVTQPGEAYSEGQPIVKTRVDREVAAWVKTKPPGWLRQLVEGAYRAETP